MMKVLVLTRYHREGPSSRIRFHQYFDHLAQNGIDVDCQPLFHEGYVSKRFAGKRNLKQIGTDFIRRINALLSASRYDLVWLQGELLPKFPALFERLLSIRKIPYVVDLDDAIFHYYSESKLWIYNTILRNKIDVVIRKASCVVAGNSYIMKYAERAGARKVELVPSVITLGKYHPISYDSLPDDPFVIGWVGTPITSKFLEPIEDILHRFMEKRNVEIHLVGSRKDVLGRVNPHYIEWNQQTEISSIAGFHVGIMPLDDEPFSRGKSGFKLIQYMAMSKPVIASDVGANHDIVDHGKNGFLVTSSETWLHALEQFYDDRSFAKEAGLSGRERVEKQYCLEVTAMEYARILKEAAESYKL